MLTITLYSQALSISPTERHVAHVISLGVTVLPASRRDQQGREVIAAGARRSVQRPR